MKTVDIMVNGKRYNLEIDSTYDNYLDTIDFIKSLSEYESARIEIPGRFRYIIIPVNDNELNDWWIIIYKDMMRQVGYSSTMLANIMSGVNTRPLRPNRNFTNSQTASGLIVNDYKRTSTYNDHLKRGLIK